MKLKNFMGAFLALAGVAFCGTAFADGSIWDIVGESLTKPADDPYRASETIRFRMRLVSPTYDQPEADREVWSVQLNPAGPYAYCIGNPSLIAMVEAMAPLKLGIVARGVNRSSLTERVAGAVLKGMPKPSAQKQLSELTFVYTTRCGDFALPLRAAADGEGHALGDVSAGEKYFFQNGPGDTGNEVWTIVTTAGTAFVPMVSSVAKTEIDCDPVRQDAATGGDFLRKLDYNIVTMAFDSREAVVDDRTYWRAVNEGSKSSKVTENGTLVVGEPRICTYDETTSPASADLRLYAWVAPGDGTDGDPSSWTWGDEKDYAVRVAPGTSARTQTFEDPDGVSRAHTVYEFAIVSNRVFYGFEFEGQHRGKAARVVLSRTPQYNWVGDSGASGVKTLLVDFLTEPVLCIDPESPTISVTVDGYGNPAEFDCAFDKYTQGHALQVRLNTPNPSNDAMKVHLEFELGNTKGFPTNIIAVSEDPAGGFSKNPLAGMEVLIPPGAYFPEKPVYLFVLGATGETAVPPGITVTPVPEARFASFIETTNSQYVVIRGMEPVIVKPSGTQESPAAAVTVSCGTPHLFAITIDDSYRNLHLLDGTNGFYTVTWERGIGKTLTITNDINGKPLLPDAYGRLNIGVTYPVSSTTNQYLSSFSVRNPEGLSSADSYITIKTRDPDYVVAETFDGSTEAVESDDEAKFVNLRFRLVPDAAGAVDYDSLYAFLEPVNAAASNCTEASFLTTAASGKSRGVRLVEGTGTTDASPDDEEPTGGLHILDGDGKSTARFNVVLCTSKEWDAEKRVSQYASKSFSLKLLNFKPAVSQVKVTDVRPGEGGSSTEKNYYVLAGGTNSTPIQTGHDIKLAVRRPGQDWNGDVAADLFATSNRQVVLRWVVYEVGEDGATSDPYAYGWEVGTNSVFTLDDGFDDEGIKKIVVQVQDKDMRDARCVVEQGGTWKYYMDPDDHDYQEWQMDENGWGDAFTFYIRISDQPTIDLLPVGNIDEYRSQALFSESQLAPFSVYDADLAAKYDVEAGNVGFKVMLSDKYNSQDKLTLVAWIEGPTNSVQLAVTNVVGFKNARQTTAKVDFPLAAFDGTYASQGVPDKYTVKARVVKAGSNTGADATNHYVIGSCDFYVRNEAPLVFLTDRKQAESDGSNSNDTIRIVKNQHVTVPWRVEDVGYDLTNATKGITITCTTSSGGTIVGVASTNVVGATGAISGSFEVYFSSAGSNWVLVEAKDKDEDVGEARTHFEVEANKNVFVYPTRPFNSSLGSDVISDYLRSPGYGYVWANGTLGGIENFMQTWTYGIASGSAIVYASGYTAGEKETVEKAANKNKAFVDANGGNVADDAKAYVCPLDRLDSFFYRWIVKSMSESGGSSGEEGEWSAKTPDPQISTNAADRIKQYTVDLPREQKDGVFADAAVMAVFAREYLWSDNLGDINQDGVPDVYVLQYKLTGGSYDAGADMKDVNYTENGKTPYCQDYLPLTDIIQYSALIPGLTDYANIKDAQAFTPRLKLRGYDANLNDATAEAFPDGVRNQAFVDGASPERRYEMEDGSWSAASCTVSYVEHLAWKSFKAVHPDATFADWSPERPTDPTKADTDNDGLTDGIEYYWWYRAHVGYLDVDATGGEVFRKATGRRYNPRNPGEGDFISSEEIERTFDPIRALGDMTQDTDNDGLPDLLEFMIGTNPFDFDTDGDGLPDGYEIMISGTNPLKAFTTPGINDGMRNFDGDAMAFTTPALEENVKPTPLHIEIPYTFALVDPNGDTDGIQWYVAKTAPTNIVVGTACVTGTVVTAAGRTFVTAGRVPVYADGDVLRLAADLPKASTWEVTDRASLMDSVPDLTNCVWIVAGEPDPASGEPTLATNATDYVALMPTRIAAGAVVTTNAATFATLVLGADVKDVNAAWVYGSRTIPTQTTGNAQANKGGYGMLAVGRYKDAVRADQMGRAVQLAALPAADKDVAYLHYLVYQEFGFDPRTAWNANTPLAARWGKTVQSGEGETESTEVVAGSVSRSAGYAGIATRTREYTTYDEFLVYSFFVNNGMTTLTVEDLGERAPSMAELWYANTTNPQGPEETVNTSGAEIGEGGSDSPASEYWGRQDENGADTDGDGVPDGWELYVMAGPKDEKSGKYVFAMPYLGAPFSAFSPFEPFAKSASDTDNSDVDPAAGDGDGLTELQEFAGTDSCAWYAVPQGARKKAFSTTIARPDEHKLWFNKFFPTDPWNKDTDMDGLGDQAEFSKFRYGSDPVDTGKTAIPGGGLNPCAIDTDRDGLPDGWEAQFAGKTVYLAEDAQFAKGTAADGTEAESTTVTLQGLCDGMDGTVFDAYTSPRINNNEENYKVILDGVDQVVDRDYDKDGLENWQEYMTGAMRVWRYDDPVTGWSYIPDDLYWTKDAAGNAVFSPNLHALATRTGEAIGSEAEFWYKTFFDTKSKLYNPHFVSGTSPSSQYFSRVTNGWDPAFTEAGTYYMFYDRVNDSDLKKAWGKAYYEVEAAPKKYICTSPIVADTDKDGMDDGYELFHGMNPILGAPGVLLSSDRPCDVVYDAWYEKLAGSPIDALSNVWMENPKGNGKYDFIAHPWLNGIVDVDPDGDDIRNQDEAIMPLVAPSTTWLHTDPTPLWMTDSSYGDSLVNRFFRLPIARGAVPVPETFTYKGVEYSLVDRDGYMVLPLIGPVIAPFFPDYWQLAATDAANWMYSFEENEGYDTDHDSGSDYEEKQGKFRSATDPQDADSPRRRQAMHFGGPENPSALQTMPFVSEGYPRAAMSYPDDMSFLQYTVECWVRPESTANATVLERTSFSDPSHVADERYVRRNFAIMIRNGKWCTAFDSNGTLDGSVVEVIGKTDVAVGEWTHVAATYDANRLTLYVNGKEDGYVMSSLKPEYGSSAVIVYPAGSGSAKTNDLVDTSTGSLEALKGTAHAYWFDSKYSLNAFLIGASFANAADGSHLDVTRGKGWNRYRDFFTGYVDEVRVWDGAQTADVIESNFSSRKRFTREDAIANRNAFYDEWVDGKLRYSKDGSGKDLDVIPELRFHWAFDSIPGAENAGAVAQAPHGFLEGDKPFYSRPEGYMIPWWSGIVDAYGSVYAGERNWVPWIPNTVTHLPRFDGSTLDSAYWSEDYAGDNPGTYKFARTAEPVSKWTQYVRNQTEKSLEFRTTDRRHWLSYNTGANGTSMLPRLFEFTGRHLNQTGDDLLPLGGAFVKYVDSMWDEQGASSVWEQTGVDGDGDGLPDWWQEYAEQNYREGVPAGEDITWDTMIWYGSGDARMWITAGEAYLRDLAKGAYVDANGEAHVGRTPYIQTADEDADGVPDWWSDLYGIRGESGLADHDNDGLPNYVEYLLSEVFDFKIVFNPVVPDSVQKGVSDYFYKIGELYAGEIFTDHDLVDDTWEDIYPVSFASRRVYDAFKDADNDGWSNRSENRYSKAVMPIMADQVSHYTSSDGLTADYPIPTIALTLHYNGVKSDAVEKAPIVVQMTTERKLERAFEAVFKIAGTADGTTGEGQTASTGTSSKDGGTDATTSYTRSLGKWSDRHALGTLTPGYINQNSVKLEFCYDPSIEVYSWRVRLYFWQGDGGSSWTEVEKRGTRAEFDADKRKYGDENIQLTSRDTDYRELVNVQLRTDESSKNAFWENTSTGERFGTLDLVSGAFDIDFGVFKGQYVVNVTNSDDRASLEDQTFRIVYSVNPPVGLPRKLYLGEATTGYVREGRNTIIAFADLDGNGVYTAGEPYGCVTDIDVSWKGTAASIELTENSAVCPRMNIADGTSDREFIWGTESGYWTNHVAGVLNGGTKTRVRIVRGLYRALASSETYDIMELKKVFAPSLPNDQLNRVVLDKYMDLSVNPLITEADFFAAGELDIDWSTLTSDIADNLMYKTSDGEIVKFYYRIVLGDGTIDPSSPNNLHNIFFGRVFDTEAGRKKNPPVCIAPGPTAESIVTESSPTFRWSLPGMNTASTVCSYPAFRIVVTEQANPAVTVYDSGIQRTPALNRNYEYEWKAPLYVGDRTLAGKVFENNRAYSWKVSMYNCKFKSDVFSAPGNFYVNVATNGYDCGNIDVDIRYFGPTNACQNKIVRVRAYTSPDFTGTPVAGASIDLGVAANRTSLTNCAANCRIVGLPKGGYYLQAFIDSNANGVCDTWESMGYLCRRDGSTPDYLNPTAVAFDGTIGKGDTAVIYIEDSDTDGDGLPDAWEYAQYGSLAAKGVEELSETAAGEFVINSDWAAALRLQPGAKAPSAGLAGSIGSTLRNAGMLALSMGAPTAGYDSFAAAISGYVTPELVDDGVRITSLDLVDGKVSIKVEAETETAGSAWIEGRKTLEVMCQVKWKQFLSDSVWTDLGEPFLITVGAEAAEIDISGLVPAGESGFYSVDVYKK